MAAATALVGTMVLFLHAGREGAVRVGAQAPADACAVTVGKTAAPAAIPLGDEVTVTLRVDGSCPELERAADVILVIDRSFSMRTDNKLEAARQAALEFVDSVDPAQVHVGVVAISATATKILGLTGDQAALRAAIAGLTDETGTNLVDALEMARSELQGPDGRPGAARVIVFMTDGRHRSGPDISAIFPILDAVRAAGMEVYAIALGSDADGALLAQLATSPAHFFHSPTAAELAAVYRQIGGRIVAAALLKTARITDALPANMHYVVHSAAPAQPVVSPDGRVLTWDLTDIKEPGLAITYRVRPLEAGRWPTNAAAALEFTDGHDKPGQRTFPVPDVIVTEPAREPCVCPIIYERWRVREADRPGILGAAATDPGQFQGWNLLQDENKPGAPPHPTPGFNAGPNPRRTCLDLMNQNVPYHPLFNSPVWRAGCLSGPAIVLP